MLRLDVCFYFPMKKYLAVALLLCALASLTNAQCHQNPIKSGERKGEKTQTVYLWFIHTSFLYQSKIKTVTHDATL